MADRLIPTSEQHRGAHVYWRGRLYDVPAGFQLMAPARLWPVITSGLLSPWGRLRLCLEPLIREPAPERDESLTEFAVRRLGRQAFERLVQPLVSGIYTADPDRLSVAAALPQMVELARQHGSLYRAMRQRQRRAKHAQQARGARYSLFVTPRDGMSEMVQTVAARLTNTEIRLRSPVRQLEWSATAGWLVDTDAATSPDPFSAVVLALPAYAAAGLLRGLRDPALADELASIPYASSAVVCCGYRQSQIQRRLDAFGCVVPRTAGRRVLAVSYSSLKYPGRAPDDCVLLRTFVGGALQPELAELPDVPLLQLVREELAEVVGAEGSPQICHVVRWPKAMPQYEVGHPQRVARIEQRLSDHPGLYLAGNGLGGVGVPQCVLSGQQAAERAVASLDAATQNAPPP
jgi:oxygen-dependent protoporphyrinogen oxidase